MTVRELLLDAFGRLPDLVHDAVDGLGDEQLLMRVDGTANHIAWLIWHLARVQDAQVAQIAGASKSGPRGRLGSPVAVAARRRRHRLRARAGAGGRRVR
jgi:hypothetical protein